MGPKMKIWQGQFSGESFCKLRLLRIRECHDILVVIPSNVLPKLHNLEELHVNKCNSVKEVFELVDKEYQVETGQIFKNLHSLEVRGCGNLIYLVTSSMAKTLVQLKVLTIEKCELVEEIVRHEGVPSTPRVKEVKIDDHAEEHFLGCDINTIIHNTALEKDSKEWDYGDSDDDVVNNDDDEVNEEEDVMRKMRMVERDRKRREWERSERMNRRMKMMTDHNQDN
ncbi:hypothetical protein CK203_116902 [Vitis vinifera]|uniref:Disease resistance protein At4g27190-like leucine-rich repeats domain-containing protein n=1 Tax=Vitis vinifera TaxID=29760 RepID=A0A438EZT7_VITVI|nr:hypothetical protein CK203_116902 [Vitis vinifera]